MRGRGLDVGVLAVFCLCLGAVRAFVVPVTPGLHHLSRSSSVRPSTCLPLSSCVQPARTSCVSRRWVKTQAKDEEIANAKEHRSFAPVTSLETLSEHDAADTPRSLQERVRLFAAANGVDSRQLNFLLNVGLISAVAALVLAKVVTVDLDVWRGWTPAEIFTRIPLDNWDGYMNVLSLHPVFVKAVTSGSVYTLGDGVAQLYEGKTLGEIDRGRVARSGIAGFVGHGPLSHWWYGVSEDFFGWLGWEGWWTTFPKITVDQLVWSPIWNGCYIFLLGAMKREALGEIVHTVKSTSFSLITSGLKLWPLAHVVTYGVIPVENRLLWVDLVEILWVTILSREAANADAEKAEATGEVAVEEASSKTLAVVDSETMLAPSARAAGDNMEPVVLMPHASNVSDLGTEDGQLRDHAEHHPEQEQQRAVSVHREDEFV